MTALADGFARRDASALIGRMASPASHRPTSAEIAAMNESLFARNDPQALSACARGMVSLFEVPADRLRAAALPVLAIVGDQDLANVESVKRMKAVVRGLEVVEIPGADHATSVRPAGAPLLAFLDRHRD